MGNISATVVRSMAVGNARQVVADLAGSSSYATGGDTLTPAALGLTQAIQHVDLIPTGTVANQRIWSVNHQADGSVKLQLATAINTEVANTTNVTAITARVNVTGY